MYGTIFDEVPFGHQKSKFDKVEVDLDQVESLTQKTLNQVARKLRQGSTWQDDKARPDIAQGSVVVEDGRVEVILHPDLHDIVDLILTYPGLVNEVYVNLDETPIGEFLAKSAREALI